MCSASLSLSSLILRADVSRMYQNRGVHSNKTGSPSLPHDMIKTKTNGRKKKKKRRYHTAVSTPDTAPETHTHARLTRTTAPAAHSPTVCSALFYPTTGRPAREKVVHTPPQEYSTTRRHSSVVRHREELIQLGTHGKVAAKSDGT